MRTRTLLILIVNLLFLCYGNHMLAQNCPEYHQLIREGEQYVSEKNFERALKKFNAAKLCEPMNAKEVDEKINGVFEAIEKEKQLLQVAEIQTKKQEALAIESAFVADSLRLLSEKSRNQIEQMLDRYTGLYISSKSKELSIKNAIKLVEMSFYKTKDSVAKSELGKTLMERFTQSSKFDFNEILLGKGTLLSTDYKWTLENIKDSSRVKSLITSKLLIIPQISKGIRIFSVSNDCRWLLASDTLNNWWAFNFFKERNHNINEIVDQIDTAFFSDNGSSLILKTKNGFKLLSLNDDLILDNLFSENEYFESFEFSKNGDYLLTKTSNGVYTYWDMVQIKQYSFPVFFTITSVKFVPKTNMVSIEGYQGLLRGIFSFYDLVTNKIADWLKIEEIGLRIETSASGRWMHWDGFGYPNFKLVDFKSKTTSKKIANDKIFFNVEFSPDENWIFYQDGKDKKKLWDSKNNMLFNFGNNDIVHLQFSPKSRFIVAETKKKELIIWNLANGKSKLLGLSYKSSSGGFEFSDNDEWVLGLCDNGWVIYNTTTKTECDLKTFQTDILKFISFKDPSNIIVKLKNNTFAILEILSNELVTKSENHTQAWRIELDSNHALIRTVNREGIIQSWVTYNDECFWKGQHDITSLITDKTENFFHIKSNYGIDTYICPRKEIINITGVADVEYFDNDNFIVFKQNNNDWILLDRRSGEVPSFLKNRIVTNLSFSTDGRFCAFCGISGAWKIYDFYGKEELDLPEQIEPIDTVVFTANNQYLFTRDQFSRGWKLWGINETKIHKRTLLPRHTMNIVTTYDDNIIFYQDQSSFWRVFTNNDFLNFEVLMEIDKVFKHVQNNKKNNLHFLTNMDGTFLIFDSRKKMTCRIEDFNTACNIEFSDNDNYFYTFHTDGSTKIWELSDENSYLKVRVVIEFKNSQFSKFKISGNVLFIINGVKVQTIDLTSTKVLANYWFNKPINCIHFSKDNSCFFCSGKGIVKVDLNTQIGNRFFWGDGEQPEYSLEEFLEWLRLFGDEYLGPLSPELIEKYGLEVKN